MNMKDLRLGLPVLLMLMAAGCGVTPPVNEGPPASIAPPTTSVPTPAVTALLESAEVKEQSGALEQAAAILERALRLEPRNAMLWHRLARLRLKQGQWRNAVDLAAKSNSLAGRDRDLQGWNWAVIAEARERLGDTQGAAAARAHLGGVGAEY
jgi:hypothetical protein